jgi:uncharacterized protein (TIGR02646 family)
MRRISKPWPPLDVSPDGQIPRSFVDAERDYRDALQNQAEKTDFARSQFDRLDKPKLRAAMYREQRSICVYCERSVAEEVPGRPIPRIDHWKPLSLHHDLALHWKNLYLSCPTKETCDSAKGELSLRSGENEPDLPWPADYAYENVLGYTSTGEIYLRTDINADEHVRKALAVVIGSKPGEPGYRSASLNLNHPALVEARAAAIDAEKKRIEREFAGRRATRPEREQHAAALLAKDRLPDFVSVRVAWLRKFLGRGLERT